MYVVNNSLRALLVALIPLGAVHAVLSAMVLLAIKATPPAELPSPDEVLVFYVTRLVSDGSLLFAGHCMLRQRAISGRIAYALMGGVMAAVSYAIAIRNSLVLSPPGTGGVLTLGLLPTFAGMIAGFLYGQFAGLAPAARFPKLSYEGLAASLAFDGPTHVRTSVGAVAIAALVPTALTTILSVMALSLLPGFLTAGPGPVIAAAIPAQLFLTIMVATVLPSAIFVLCLHHIARVLHRKRARDYALTGGVLATICALLLAPVSPFTSLAYMLGPAATYGAIMGAVYRRFAGLEPLPLPEPVLANDLNALVGADHPARQQHRVILSN